MATFFGEILPVISRAVDDDEDDGLAPKPKQLFMKWTSESESRNLDCDTLIVTAGEVAWKFAELYYKLDKSNQAAEIREFHDEDDGCGFEAISRQPKIVTSLYKVSAAEKVMIFASCKGYIPSEQIWPLTTKILENVINFKNIFVLTSSTIQEYKCEDVAAFETPLMRSLPTAMSPAPHPLFPILEQPNMLKNIPAAILSYSQFRGIPAVAYVCYTENMHLDVASVQAFTKLLDTPQFNNGRGSDVATKKILQSVKNSNMGHALYT